MPSTRACRASVKLVTSDSKLFRLFEKNHLPRKRLLVGWEPTSKAALLLWPITYFIARRRLKKLLVGLEPESVIFCQSLIEKLIFTPLAKKKFKLFWLEHKIPGRWLTKNPLKYRYLKLAKAVTLVTVSNFAKQEFIKLGIHEKKIKVIYPGIKPISYFPRLQAYFTIGLLSRLDPEKGVLDFLKILIPKLKNRPDWRTVIAGEGKDKIAIQKLIQSNTLGGQIEPLGFVNDLDRFFSQISVMVYPTKVSEAFGISVLEAMARGVPVVASKLGALPEIIEHEKSGFLVEPESTDSFNKYLERLSDRPSRLQIGENALEKAQNFSEKIMLQEFKSLVQQNKKF